MNEEEDRLEEMNIMGQNEKEEHNIMDEQEQYPIEFLHRMDQ